MNSSFPNRWSFSYLKSTKYVTNIVAEPKYKYSRQEQKKRKEPQQKYRLGTVSTNILGGLNRFYGYPSSPSASIMAQNIQLFGPRGGLNTDSKNSKEPQQKYRLGTVSIKILGGLNLFYEHPTSPSASIMAQNKQLFGPRGGFLTHQWITTGNK